MSRPTEAARTVRRQAKIEAAEGFRQYSEEEQEKKAAREHFDALFYEDFEVFAAKLERITRKLRPARVVR